MIALLSVSAFFLTISYVFSEIMGAALSVERDELAWLPRIGDTNQSWGCWGATGQREIRGKRMDSHPDIEVFDDLRKVLLGLLVQVADGDASREDGIVRVGGGQIRSRLISWSVCTLEEYLESYLCRQVVEPSREIKRRNRG
jgi:hypothetical protein